MNLEVSVNRTWLKLWLPLRSWRQAAYRSLTVIVTLVSHTEMESRKPAPMTTFTQNLWASCLGMRRN